MSFNAYRRLHRLVQGYSCQNATLLEITCHGSNIELSQKFPLETNEDADNSDKQLCRWHHEGVLNFCKDAWSNTIEGQGLAVSVEDLFTLLEIAGSDRKEFVSAFMDTKKSHEVDIMSDVCVHLFKSTGCKLVSTPGPYKH